MDVAAPSWRSQPEDLEKSAVAAAAGVEADLVSSGREDLTRPRKVSFWPVWRQYIRYFGDVQHLLGPSEQLSAFRGFCAVDEYLGVGGSRTPAPLRIISSLLATSSASPAAPKEPPNWRSMGRPLPCAEQK